VEPVPVWKTLWLCLWPAAVIVLFDQISKLLIVNAIPPGVSVPVFGDFLMLTHQMNPAGAMSIRLGPPAFYLIVTAVVVVFIGYTLVRKPLHTVGRWSLLLVLAGAVGNMIDRIRLGAVIDFVDVEFFDFSLPAINWGPIHVPGEVMTRWPVFNVADAAVTIGIVLLIVSTFLPHSTDEEAPRSGE